MWFKKKKFTRLSSKEKEIRAKLAEQLWEPVSNSVKDNAKISWLDARKWISKEALAVVYINRLNAWMTPNEAVKWLVNPKNIDKFIEDMEPIVRASFLEVTPIALNRLTELMYAKKEVLNKDWKVVELVDNDTAIKAADLI